MMNKNKNKVMYLDLTENEIKQYVEGGYIVEEDGPGDPPKNEVVIKIKKPTGPIYVKDKNDPRYQEYLKRKELYEMSRDHFYKNTKRTEKGLQMDKAWAKQVDDEGGWYAKYATGDKKWDKPSRRMYDAYMKEGSFGTRLLNDATQNPDGSWTFNKKIGKNALDELKRNTLNYDSTELHSAPPSESDIYKHLRRIRRLADKYGIQPDAHTTNTYRDWDGKDKLFTDGVYFYKPQEVIIDPSKTAKEEVPDAMPTRGLDFGNEELIPLREQEEIELRPLVKPKEPQFIESDPRTVRFKTPFGVEFPEEQEWKNMIHSIKRGNKINWPTAGGRKNWDPRAKGSRGLDLIDFVKGKIKEVAPFPNLQKRLTRKKDLERHEQAKEIHAQEMMEYEQDLQDRELANLFTKEEGGSIEMELDDDAIMKYAQAGYIVEDLNEMHEGGEPGHSHLLDNPFTYGNTRSLFPKLDTRFNAINEDFQNNLNELNREHQQKMLQIQLDAKAINWQKDKTGKLKPKDKSNKYELIKPSDYIRERELTSYSQKQINRILKSAVSLTPQQIGAMQTLAKKDPISFLKDYANEYPVLDQESGVYTIYPAQKIRDRIYHNGMSARKISENLGIGTKNDIRKDFKKSFEHWQSDYDYNIKTAINKYIEQGLSREQAVNKLVKSGAVDREGVERVFNTSLDILEVKKWENEFLNKTVEEQNKEVEQIIKSGKTFKNPRIQGQVDKMINTFEKQQAEKKRIADENKRAKEGLEQLRRIEQQHNYIMAGTDDVSGPLSYTMRENEGREFSFALKEADTGYSSSLTDKYGLSPTKEVQLETRRAENWIKDDIKSQIRNELDTENRIYKGSKRHGLPFHQRSGEDIEKLVNERYLAWQKKGNNPASKSWQKKYFTGEAYGYNEGGGQSKGLEFNSYKVDQGKQSVNDDAIEQIDDQILQLEKSPSIYINGKPKSSIIANLNKQKSEYSYENSIIRSGTVTEGKFEGTLLDPKFQGEAGFWDKFFNPGAAAQYDRLNLPMPSNFSQYKKLQEEQKQLTGSYSGDAALEADDRNVVGKTINFGAGFTPAGLMYHGAEGARHLVQVDIPEIQKKGLTWETGLPAGMNLFLTALGTTAARTGVKKLVNSYAPNVTGTIPGIQDDLIEEAVKKGEPKKWLQRTGTKIDNVLQETPGIIRAPYNAIKTMGKDIIKMDEEYLPNLPLANLISDTKTVSRLGLDAMRNKNVQRVGTAAALTYLPENLESAAKNYEDENWTGLGYDAFNIGASFVPGFAFKNFRSTGKAGYDLLRKGLGYEGQNFYKGLKGLGKFGSRQGNLYNKALGWSTDAAKAGYHGSVLYYTPDALTGGFNLLTDKDATTSERFKNAAKFTSVLPGVAGYSNAKYAVGAGLQFASDPTDKQNWVDAGLTYGLGRPGISRYGTRFFGKQDESKHLLDDTTDDVTPARPVSVAAGAGKNINKAEVEENEVEENEVEDTEEVGDITDVTKKKKKKKKKQKTVKRIRGKKIFEDGGEIDESVELLLDANEIQKYILGGYIVEEI